MNSLNDYEVFCKLYKAFQETYAKDNDNNTLSFKEIDQYLWFYATEKAKNDDEFKKLIRIEDTEIIRLYFFRFNFNIVDVFICNTHSYIVCVCNFCRIHPTQHLPNRATSL